MSEDGRFPYEVLRVGEKESPTLEIRSPFPVELPGCGATLACLFVIGDGVTQGDFGKVLIGAVGLYCLNKLGRKDAKLRSNEAEDSLIEVSAESSIVS